MIKLVNNNFWLYSYHRSFERKKNCRIFFAQPTQPLFSTPGNTLSKVFQFELNSVHGDVRRLNGKSFLLLRIDFALWMQIKCILCLWENENHTFIFTLLNRFFDFVLRFLPFQHFHLLFLFYAIASGCSNLKSHSECIDVYFAFATNNRKQQKKMQTNFFLSSSSSTIVEVGEKSAKGKSE